jgi:transcriptional regulator with XRE-family HTH domain
MAKAPNPIDKHVGARVRMRRVLIGMSQEKLGEALGITFQQVQKYEKGTNRMGASRLQQAARIMGVPVNFFFEGTQSDTAMATGFAEPGSPAYLADFASTQDGSQLIKAFTKIKDPKVRRRIIELVEAMASEDQD